MLRLRDSLATSSAGIISGRGCRPRPTAVSVLLPGVGHFVPQAAPGEVLRPIETFPGGASPRRYFAAGNAPSSSAAIPA